MRRLGAPPARAGISGSPRRRRGTARRWRLVTGAAIAVLVVVPWTGAGIGAADPGSGSASGSSDGTRTAGTGSAGSGSNSGAAAHVDDFYHAPDPLPPGVPGDVIRRSPFALKLSVPGHDGPLPGRATRIMYRSNDTNDRPVAVTGTYLEPTLAWKGPGPRPLIAVAPGTQGQGHQCAPSKTLGELVHYTAPFDLWFTSYEVLTAYTFLVQGMAVVMTDYYGFTDNAVHDYVNRKSGAHAVLDSIRAAESLTGTHPRAVIAGYSEGGNAAAAAAELQSQYAPELDLIGSYVGAPPADLRAMLDTSQVIDGVVPGIGGLAPGLVGYVLNGLIADYPQVRPILRQALSPAGRAMLEDAARACVAELAVRTTFREIARYTAAGKPLDQVIDESPALAQVVDEQRIGRLRPAAPVLVAASSNDDVIPYKQVRQLASDWCVRGAVVQLDRTSWLPPLLPSLAIVHGLEMLPALAEAVAWIKDRLAGQSAPTNCAALP